MGRKGILRHWVWWGIGWIMCRVRRKFSVGLLHDRRNRLEIKRLSGVESQAIMLLRCGSVWGGQATVVFWLHGEDNLREVGIWKLQINLFMQVIVRRTLTVHMAQLLKFNSHISNPFTKLWYRYFAFFKDAKFEIYPFTKIKIFWVLLTVNQDIMQ